MMHSLQGMQQQVCGAKAGGSSSSPKVQNQAFWLQRYSQRLMLPSSLTRPPGCTLSIATSPQTTSSAEPTPLPATDGFLCGWSDDTLVNNGAKEGNNHGCAGPGNNSGEHVIEQSKSSYAYLGNELFCSDLSCTGNGEFSTELGASRTDLQRGSDTWDTSKTEIFNVFHHCRDGFASIEACVLTLQDCRNTKNLAYARSVHLHICSNGLEIHKAVENYIVPMFVECGSIFDAQITFNKLSCRKEHSWTSLISGYCDSGQLKHAFYIYRQMEEDGENLSIHTFVALLRAFTLFKDLEKGREIHVEIVRQGFETNVLVGSSLIGMYSKCGLLTEALDAFEDLSIQDTSTWTALIAGYAEFGPYREALFLFEEMKKQEGVLPGRLTYTCGLKACANMAAIDMGCAIHTELVIKGWETDLYVGSTLVYMYAECGSLAEAQKVFNELPCRDVVSWNALIAGYVDYGAGYEALACYEKMKQEGIYPDTVTYVSILKACSSVGAICQGREIHVELVQVAKEGDICFNNSLVGMYAKCGSPLEAHKVFDQWPAQDVVVWTSLIAGYAEYGPAQEALNCLKSMQLEGISPDDVLLACSLKACSNLGAVDKGQEIHMEITKRGFEKELLVGISMVSMYAKLGLVSEAKKAFDSLPEQDVVLWTALMAGYAEHGYVEEASNCVEQMQLDGIAPNLVTFTCALKACESSGGLIEGQKLHREIVIRGFETDLLIGNTLVGMYARCHSLLEAQDVFDNLQVQDAVSWNTLISGLAEHESGQEILNIYERMLDQGYSPDSVTLVCILKVCGSVGAIEKGREIHMKIREGNFDRDSSVGNSLISMYAKCGSLTEAQEVFDMLPVRDVVAWSTMIKAYGMNHQGEKAIQCFKDMQDQDVRPDSVTFSCLLLACSHTGMVREGLEYFKMLREKYGIVPTVEHYSCIIDLLARSGHLYEAENFIMIACPSSEVIWGSLLSGCKTYGETELGFRCFQNLVQMNAELAAWYVLMADVFATAGRKHAVKRIEELRKHLRANKKPARATIEVNHRVHEFVVGNFKNAEVLEMLSTLSSRLKEEGHLPNIELILKSNTDMRKEAALCEHAEKLALAFGLLNTAEGATLRVTKNLRMCNDCHSTSKIISKFERREIILRDDCCIHHFKDGACSCGDSF